MKEGITRAKEHLMAKKSNVVAFTMTSKTVTKVWKLFKGKAVTTSIYLVYSATYDNNERVDEVEISTPSNDKG